jgi:hypothetical protein
VNSGVTPSLMLGLAGIAHFYLRLYNWAIPSVLMVYRRTSQLRCDMSVR